MNIFKLYNLEAVKNQNKHAMNYTQLLIINQMQHPI